MNLFAKYEKKINTAIKFLIIIGVFWITIGNFFFLNTLLMDTAPVYSPNDISTKFIKEEIYAIGKQSHVVINLESPDENTPCKSNDAPAQSKFSSRSHFCYPNDNKLSPSQTLFNFQTQEQSKKDEDISIDYLSKKISNIGYQVYTHNFTAYLENGDEAEGQNIYTQTKTKNRDNSSFIVIAYRRRFEVSYRKMFETYDNEVVAAITLMKEFTKIGNIYGNVIFLGYDNKFPYGIAIDKFLKDKHKEADNWTYYGDNIHYGIIMDIGYSNFNTLTLNFGKK